MEKSDSVKLRVEDIWLNFGGVAALSGVSFDVREGEMLAIIGPNGAGKTSILNCINGFYRPQKGGMTFEDQNIYHLPPHRIARLGIGRTFQNIELFTGLSVLDNLMAARHLHLKRGALAGAIYFGPARREEIRHREVVEDIIDLLEMEPYRKRVVGLLPYGVRKRVELGRALALEPKLLLLDEPMAGMNIEEKKDMARFIIDIHCKFFSNGGKSNIDRRTHEWDQERPKGRNEKSRLSIVRKRHIYGILGKRAVTGEP
jgi:branched-chain amino acid transport system ATP-binding protein